MKNQHRLTHGHNRLGRRTKAYRTWAHIKGRCYNPKDASYKHYGGRGIQVCQRWRDSFQNFLADMGNPEPGLTLERRDNDGDYCPENCYWGTYADQSRNTRKNVRIDGECLKDVCAKRSLSYEAVQARLRRGHPVAVALSPLMGHAYRRLLSAAKGGEG